MTPAKYKEIFNRKWILVFYHKFENDQDLFKSKEEALQTNQPKKYSILGKIDTRYAISREYEFLLEYPKFAGYYNHWAQTKNPIFANAKQDNGYREINISWNENYWKELALSSSGYTLIDGSPYDDTWFYSIGLYDNWRDAIPANIELGNYPENQRKKYTVREALLWIRILFRDSKCYCRTHFINLFPFSLILLLS